MNAGLNYISLYHNYDPSNGEYFWRRDFQRFNTDGVSHISIALIWNKIETNTRGIYENAILDNIKIFLDVAKEYNLNVMITFLMVWDESGSWMIPTYINDPITNVNMGLAIVRDPGIYTAFMDMVNHTITYLKDSSKWCYALNEPWYWGRTSNEHDYVTLNGKTQKENFIQLMIDMSATVKNTNPNVKFTSRFPIVKPWGLDANGNFTKIKNIFEEDWSFDYRIINTLDYIGFNIYIVNAALISQWRNMILQNISTIKGLGKSVWITEIGNDSNDDDIQDAAYKMIISTYSDIGVDGHFAWEWMSEVAIPGNDQNPPFGFFNIANPDGTPRKAYYELFTGILTCDFIYSQ